MIDQDLLQKALNQAYFFLKFRMRTEKEIRVFLSKKAKKYHWPTEVINQVLMILKEEKLIDDRQFIKIFVNQRKALKPKGVFTEWQRQGSGSVKVGIWSCKTSGWRVCLEGRTFKVGNR